MCIHIQMELDQCCKGFDAELLVGGEVIVDVGGDVDGGWRRRAAAADSACYQLQCIHWQFD